MGRRRRCDRYGARAHPGDPNRLHAASETGGSVSGRRGRTARGDDETEPRRHIVAATRKGVEGPRVRLQYRQHCADDDAGDERESGVARVTAAGRWSVAAVGDANG